MNGKLIKNFYAVDNSFNFMVSFPIGNNSFRKERKLKMQLDNVFPLIPLKTLIKKELMQLEFDLISPIKSEKFLYSFPTYLGICGVITNYFLGEMRKEFFSDYNKPWKLYNSYSWAMRGIIMNCLMKEFPEWKYYSGNPAYPIITYPNQIKENNWKGFQLRRRKHLIQFLISKM